MAHANTPVQLPSNIVLNCIQCHIFICVRHAAGALPCMCTEAEGRRVKHHLESAVHSMEDAEEYCLTCFGFSLREEVEKKVGKYAVEKAPESLTSCAHPLPLPPAEFKLPFAMSSCL